MFSGRIMPAAAVEAGNGAPIGGLGVTVPRVMTWTLPHWLLQR